MYGMHWLRFIPFNKTAARRASEKFLDYVQYPEPRLPTHITRQLGGRRGREADRKSS